MPSSGHAHRHRDHSYLSTCREFMASELSANWVSLRCGVYTGQGDEIETELIPTVKMETGHPVETHLVTSLRRSISLGSYRGLKSQVVEHFGEKIALFEKATPYGEIFIILFQKDSPPHRSTSCL